MQGNLGADGDPPSGVVELREDAPLKAAAGGGAAACSGGPRLLVASFAALTAAITLALFTQIYYGDYEVVPHGSVSSSVAECSRAGTDALKAGGRALDAAVAAALCLAVTAPHLTSLDASGSLLYWEYRQLRTQKPTLAEWGEASQPEVEEADAGAAAGEGERPPRLVAALAALHAEYGALPWSLLLQPAIELARDGFKVSPSLATALAAEAASGAEGGVAGVTSPPAGSSSTAPQLAAYLESLQLNTSSELSAQWGGAGAAVRVSPAVLHAAGAVRVYAGGGADIARALRALTLALDPKPADVDEASKRVTAALEQEAAEEGGSEAEAGGVATGLAVIDRLDTYVALVTGLQRPFGGRGAAPGGERGAAPGGERGAAPGGGRPLGLAPAFVLRGGVCGTRSVLGGESGAALARVAAALALADGAAAVERARPAAAAVNLVQQRGDALLSHADSRGGGLASRF